MTEREVENVLEGFTGRRAFGKGLGHGARGEVFKYPEFMASILGGAEGEQKSSRIIRISYRLQLSRDARKYAFP